MSSYFDDFSSFSTNPLATMLDNRREISSPSSFDSEISMCEDNNNNSGGGGGYHHHSRLFQESTSQPPAPLSHVAEDLIKSIKTCSSTTIDETSQDGGNFCEMKGFFVSYKQLLELNLDDFEKQITGIDYNKIVKIDEISQTSEHDDEKKSRTKTSSSRVEKDDRKAALRLRNRLAARRYQERLKMQAIESAHEIEQIEDENKILRIKIESAGMITKKLREFAHKEGFIFV